MCSVKSPLLKQQAVQAYILSAQILVFLKTLCTILYTDTVQPHDYNFFNLIGHEKELCGQVIHT